MAKGYNYGNKSEKRASGHSGNSSANYNFGMKAGEPGKGVTMNHGGTVSETSLPNGGACRHGGGKGTMKKY